MKRLALILIPSLCSSIAFAGGLEFPDNNTEALSRGAAFTAKADDASALEYNVAGLARQRGTRLLLSANFVSNTYQFQRSGVYPDNPSDPNTPYGGQPYAPVSQQGGIFPAPFLGISTDFNYFDRWTFAVGVFGPSSYGSRSYPTEVNGIPSASRYDLVHANLLLVLPTLAAAVRVTKWLELGIALHLVLGTFDLESIGFVDLGRGTCPQPEYANCDASTTLNLTGFTATAALGAMLHPGRGWSIGVNLRGPVVLDATGTVNGTPPKAQSVPINQDVAYFHTELPWVLRLGLRYAWLSHKDGFEDGDVELDGTYESWSTTDSEGPKIRIPNLAIFQDINPTVTHHYRDTFSVRLGGSYNIRLPAGVLAIRAGFFFDSAATHYADTRLDFDTMAKYAPTVGLGYRIRGIAINVGYAYIWEPDRDVTNGDIRPINPVTNGSSNSSTFDANGKPVPLPAVNNGHYHASTQIFSLSLNIAWDEALKKQRKLAYE
jgi:long-chain fatty acid transport protein